MAQLNLFVFGPPRLEGDGAAVNLSRRKVIGLLVYLAVTGQMHHRDALTALLWPDYEAGKGRGYLRRLLSDLNKTLGPGVLEITGEEVGLITSDRFQLDVAQFHTCLNQSQSHDHPDSEICADCIAPLTQAATLYRDDFLTGFTLPDCPEFDDWQFFQGEGLRQSLLSTLKKLIDWHQAQAEFEPAIAYARRWLALDNLHEPAHQTLMRLYAQTGQPAAALRQYELCVQILEEELGVSPTTITTTLYEQIRAGKIDQAGPVSAIPPPQASPQSFASPQPIEPERAVFVGRESQLAELEQALSQTLLGQGQLRFIIGEAGAGKSALQTEFQYQTGARQADLVIATGACDAQTGLADPYLPFREILTVLAQSDLGGSILQAHGPDLLDTLVPRSVLGWSDRVQAGQAEVKPVEQSQIFDQAIMVFKTLAEHNPLLLILEDLHWADEASLGLLFRLGRQLRGSRILILGTYRSEETRRKRGDQPHALQNMVQDLQRNLGDLHLDLDAALTAEGLALIEALLDTEPNRLDSTFRQTLYKHTRGHPLFVIELLRDLQKSGGLVQDHEGYWLVGPDLDWTALPARVEGMVARRMARLDGTERQLLTVASVIGEHFMAEAVAQALQRDGREVALTLSGSLQKEHKLVQIETVSRVGQERLSQYRFRHNLMQVYLYEQLDEAERSFLHEDVGYALEALYGDQANTIAVQLARHFRQAGLLDKAIGYLISAGENAERVSAHAEAIGHLTQARTLLAERPETPETLPLHFSTHFALGRVFTASQGQGNQEAGDAFARALVLGRQLAEGHQVAQVLSYLTFHALFRAEMDLAQAYGQECLRLAEANQDPELQIEANKALHFVTFSLGQHAAAVGHTEQVITLYQTHRPPLSFDDAADLAHTMSLAGISLVPLGYPDQALRQAQEGVALVQRHEHQSGIASCLGLLSAIHTMRGTWQAGQRFGEEQQSISISRDFFLNRTFGELHTASALAMLGKVDEALALARPALAERRALGINYVHATYLAQLAEGCGRAGRVAEGLELVNEALTEVANDHQYEVKVHQIKGDLLLLQDLPPDQMAIAQQEAEACFRQAIEIAQYQQAKLWEARALASLCRLLHRQGRDEGCRQQLADLYAWFTEGFETEDLQVVQAVLETIV